MINIPVGNQCKKMSLTWYNSKNVGTNAEENVGETFTYSTSKCSLFKWRESVLDDTSDFGQLTKVLSHCAVICWQKKKLDPSTA